MRNYRLSIQKDLFDSSRSQELHMRVQELDLMIKRALKDLKYDQAREWIQEQERIIQELVAAGEDHTKAKKE